MNENSNRNRNRHSLCVMNVYYSNDECKARYGMVKGKEKYSNHCYTMKIVKKKESKNLVSQFSFFIDDEKKINVM